MRHNEERHSLSSLCALLGYSRQAFYQFEKNNNQACFEAELVIQQVLLHRSLQPRLGARKLLVLMQDFVREPQLKLGRDALVDLLRTHKLLVKKRRRKVQTTFSKHWQKKYRSGEPSESDPRVRTKGSQLVMGERYNRTGGHAIFW